MEVAELQEMIGDLEARQQPDYPDLGELNLVLGQLRDLEPLVTVRDTDLLTKRLGSVANGEAFLLQGGSCGESFDDPPDSTTNFLRVFLAMTVTLMSRGLPVVKTGRIAGQYAKPRSLPTETRDGLVLPAFRGDIINSPEFIAEARQADPRRMLIAYAHSQATLQKLSKLAKGGFADLEHMHEWNVLVAESSSQGERYQAVIRDVAQAISFMKAAGIKVDLLSELHEAELYTAHEGLLIPYELALTRPAPGRPDKLYATSAHMLWVGERTRALDEAHITYLEHIENPIASKLGPTATPEEVREYCERLNPNNIPGRLTFISRMGKGNIEDRLPPLIQAARRIGASVIWACDPMHGNTVTTKSGHKTRDFEVVAGETVTFIDICRGEGVKPGGVHLEITGEDVTECIGGSPPFAVDNLEKRYETNCDPRLNPPQGIELAFRIAERLGKATVVSDQAVENPQAVNMTDNVQAPKSPYFVR